MKLTVVSCLPCFVLSVVALCAQSPAPDISDAAALEIGRAYIRYQQALREAGAGVTQPERWWQTAPMSYPTDVREKLAEAGRQFHDRARSALQTEPLRPTGRDPRFTFLPEAKQEAVTRIDLRAAERLSDIRRDLGQSRLPSDVQHVQKINAERESELAKVLSPAEREMLELRTSPVSATIRQRYGELIQSEEEYRKIFALQKTFEEKFSQDEMMFSARPSDVYRLRSEAEHKLVADIGEVVGEARATAFRRAIDQDYIAVAALCRRLKLPATAAEEIMKIRENYSTQTLTVNGETGLSFSDKRALVQSLAKDAQKEVAAVLGKEGMDAYQPRSSWLRYLESGTAFSTDPKDSRISGSISSPSMGVYFVSSTSTFRPAAPAPAASGGSASLLPPGTRVPATKSSDEKQGTPPSTPAAAPPAK